LSKFEYIIKKLDLDEHIDSLVSKFAREKSPILIGDASIHAKFINALDSIELISLPPLPNMDDLINRLSKGAILQLEQLYLFVKQIYFFNKLKATSLPAIWREFVDSIEIPSEVLEVITYFNDEGLIDTSKDEELYSIKESLDRLKQEQKEKLSSILRSNALKDYLVDSSIHLYYGQETLLVRGGFSKVLKANVVGRSSGGFFYVVPQALEDIKQRGSRLLDREQEIYLKYAKKFSSIFAKWWRFFKYLDREFDRVDHYFARALMLREKDLSLILPNKTKEVKLASFAHPAIKDAKPIDIEFKSKIMLVTGVNAGGKTMLLKSILGAILMSKYLIPYKCNSNETKVGSFENIEVILDDPQSVKNDISTFAGRIVEFNRLFKLKDAIVGVDEIELGTDANEAAALFRVLLEELTKRDIYFIVTTHHKQLASLMSSNKDVELIAALYDEKNQRPTYTYLSGSIGKSYAFETARRYGINDNLIKRAKEALGEDQERIAHLIESSTQLEIKMRQKLKEAQDKVEQIKEQERKVEAKKERIEQEYKKRLFDLEREYQEALKKLKLALKETENPNARRLINEAHKIKSSKKEERRENIELKVGDNIEYRGKRGVILSLKSKEAMVDLDGIKMRVPKSELKVIKPLKKPKVKKPTVNVSVAKPNRSKISLKILGYRAEEAIDEVQNFISDALLHGFNEVEIIHGSGSGVLSKVVSDLLKKHPKVKSFNKVPGNLGATLVKL